MKRFLKSSFSIFLALTIIFSSAYVGLSESDFNFIFDFNFLKSLVIKTCAASDDFLFTLNDDCISYSVVGYSGTGENVIIPDTFNNKPVTSIGTTFMRNYSIRSVTIPNSVTSIAHNAFYECINLESITIPDSVTSIGSDAFYKCTGFTSITIPDSVTSIGESAFYLCGNLESVTIGNGVTDIASYTFQYCDDLKTVNLGNGVTSIGAYAFENCTRLTSITIPDSVLSIAGSAFQKTNLISVTIPDSVTTIGSGAFQDCQSLETINIGKGVTSIGMYAFSGCNDLEKIYWNAKNVEDFDKYDNIFDEACCDDDDAEIIFGDYVEKVPAYLCYPSTYCGIESVVIGENVKSIGEYAFYNCTDLTKVTNGDNVTSIGEYAFYNCTSLQNISISDSVTNIGAYSFYNCTDLISVEISNNMTSINDYTFYNCTNLQTVTISDNVAEIGDYVFSNCESLKSIALSENIADIGLYAFKNCTSLRSINVDEHNSVYSSLNGVLFNKDKTELICYPAGKIDSSYVFPESITSVGEYTFYNCTYLKSISFHENITTICDNAFESCVNLTSITIPDSVKRVGKNAFYKTGYYNDDSNWEDDILYINGHLIRGFVLNSCAIKSGTKIIADGAFEECSWLTSIEVPDTVTDIGVHAFMYCSRLKEIYIDDIEKWCEINFWGYAANPLQAAFDNKVYHQNELLTKLFIPDNVKHISDRAFANWSTLTYVSIPDSVTSIGAFAFEDCENLETINIGKGVTSIGADAFKNTSYLNSYYTNQYGKYFDIIIDGCLIKPKTNIGYNYEMASNVRVIADRAFAYNRDIVSIKIGDGVTHIGKSAFEGCSNLTSVTMPNSVTSIDSAAFCYCSSLKSITLPDGVTNIGSDTFSECSNLESIVIPKSVKHVDDYAFENCNVKYVFYKGSMADWSIIDIAEGNNCLQNSKIHYKATGHTSSSWIIDKEATVYKTGSKHQECTQCGEKLKTATIPQLKCSKPVLKKVYNANSYVKVTWGTVKGADLYRVYRKTSTGDYEYIGSTTHTYFNDKEAGAGKTCRYKIRAKNEAGYSEYSKSLAVKHIDEPTLKSIENSAYGVLIKWDKVTGAEKYNIYRKVSGGEYEYLGATSDTYYTDKTAESGTKYYYATRGKRDDSVSSQSASLSKYYLEDPILNTPTSKSEGIGLRWSEVTGAEGYKVYRKTADGSYKLLTTEKGASNVTFRDTTANKGTEYTYQVKAYYSKTYSAYSNTQTIIDNH